MGGGISPVNVWCWRYFWNELWAKLNSWIWSMLSWEKYDNLAVFKSFLKFWFVSLFNKANADCVFYISPPPASRRAIFGPSGANKINVNLSPCQCSYNIYIYDQNILQKQHVSTYLKPISKKFNIHIFMSIFVGVLLCTRHTIVFS